VTAGTGGVTGRAPAVSAHRGGGETAPPETYEAYRDALAAGAGCVEVDVRRTADGTLVAWHRARARGRAVASVSYGRLCALAGYEVPRLAAVMALLAGRAVCHLDLKDAGCAAAAVAQAAGVAGPAGVIATTGDAALAAALRRAFPAVPVGLTAGGDLAETARYRLRRACMPRLSRLDRVLAAGAGWAVLHHRLAGAALLAECRARGIRTMVWTVNGDRELTRWLATPGVDVLVTDCPARAVALRGRLAAGRAGAPGASWSDATVRI